MTTVAIREKYAEILSDLGDVESAVDIALQRYTIEQVTAKVADFRRRDGDYQAKYGLDYLTFKQRMARDEEFVIQIEHRVSKTWEADLVDWEYCHQGREDWTQQLQSILLIS